MRCAGNSVVTRHCVRSCLIGYGPLVNGGVEATGKLGRARFVMFQLGNDARGGLPQFFALTKRLAIIFDDKSGTDAEEDDEELAEAYAYHQEFVSQTPELYQAPTLKRIRAEAGVTAVKYIQSKRELESVRRSIARAFDDVDLLITPTVCIPPFNISDLEGDPDTARQKELSTLHNTRPLNFPGLPTISVPCGFTRSGLPIGLQISARPGDEERACRLAHAYEESTDWHKREPNLS
jgi:Asp-tRNA(Asn)/Glu-tRNA(Gln) amidotransferase A subunit family amidase